MSGFPVFRGEVWGEDSLPSRLCKWNPVEGLAYLNTKRTRADDRNLLASESLTEKGRVRDSAGARLGEPTDTTTTEE